MLKENIFYLHIPKTAGTTLNSFICSHFSSEEHLVHFENTQDWREKKFEGLMQKKFLSGHVRFPLFLSISKNASYFKFSVFRNPIEQIISHLAWVRHLSAPGNEEFFMQHPLQIQEISKKMSRMDLSDPDIVSDYTRSMSPLEIGLFDNCQTRYLLNIPRHIRLTRRHAELALFNLKKLDMIGLNDRLYETIIILCHHMQWIIPEKTEKLNVSKSKFGLDHKNSAICDALEEMIQFDRIIYNEARNIFNSCVYKVIEELEKLDSDASSFIDANKVLASLSKINN